MPIIVLKIFLRELDMRSLLFIALLPFAFLHCKETPPPAEKNVAEYLKMYQQFPQILGPQGSWKEGEIEIALDPAKIKEIEAKAKQSLLSKGISEANAEKWSRVGVITSDGYWMWIRDAVTFPSGATGTYNRVFLTSSLLTPSGVAVMAMLPSKKIVVNLNYRHATRSWELELPRGGRKANETVVQAAKRELKEETGYVTDDAVLLGIISPDSGAIASSIPIFFAKVSQIVDTEQDESEAILEILSFTKDELKQGLVRGYMEITVDQQVKKVPCRDSFLAFALLLAETKGYL